MSAISADVFASASYDYVIAGGGTAGLTLAARLTEDPTVSVAVIEAGQDRSGDLDVNAWGLTARMLGNPLYDWGFKTTPQADDDGRVIFWPRGKQLGGSSGLNFWYWNRPSQDDINSWEKLGNDGWGWSDLFPYFLKSESYEAPSSQGAIDLGLSYVNLADHGKTGPIQTSFPASYGRLGTFWNPTYAALGLEGRGDPYGGDAIGSFSTLLSQDLKNASRSYATTAYYHPNAARANLKVLTGANANRVVFEGKKGHDGRAVASGVNFTVGGTSYVVKAKQEVILSAGVTQSPQLLELSGIGSDKLLRSFGIDVVVDNDNVGENLQDHQFTSISFRAADGVPTLDELNDPAVYQQAVDNYTSHHDGILAEATCSTAYLSYRQLLETAKEGSHFVPDDDDEAATSDAARKCPNLRPGLEQQYDLIIKKLRHASEPFAQEIYSAVGLTFPPVPGSFVSLFGLLAHPFSRGSIHINSSDPSAPPTIDPRFLSNPLDLDILSTIAFHLETVATTQPLASLLQGNGTVFAPGSQHLTDANVRQHVRDTLGEFQHPIGTCAMMPRDRGGVVDTSLRVYGTSNLRVVDASVIPIQPVGTIQSLVYAVAEKAADLIKAGGRGGK